MRAVLVIAQTLTFVGLGALLFKQGEGRLATAQLCLAAVTVLVYI